MPTTNKPITFDGEQHREMTDAEYAEYQVLQSELAEREAANVAKAAIRAAALAKLGLTADEAAALFG